MEKKIDIKSLVLKLANKVICRAGVFFTLFVLILGAVGYNLGFDMFKPEQMFHNLMFALSFGISSLVFEISFLSQIIKFIVNAVVTYAGFFIFIITMGARFQTGNTIPVVSIFFAVIYLIAAGLFILFRFVINNIGVKKEEYKSLFDGNLKK